MLLKHQALGLKVFCDSSYTSKSKSLKQKLLNHSSQSPVLSRIFSSPTQLNAFIRKVADAERTQLAPAVEDDLDGFPELPNVLDYTAKLQTNMSVFMENYASKEQLAYYAKIGFSMKILLTFLKTDYQEQIGYFYLDMGALDMGDGDALGAREARRSASNIFDPLIQETCELG